MIDTSRRDNHFLRRCMTVSEMSKDPSTRVGAVVVDEDDIWVSVRGFPNYEVSSFGNVRSLDTTDRNGRIRRGKILKYRHNRHGYPQVDVRDSNSVKTCKVSRLVAVHFIPNPFAFPEVLHGPDNDKNNCNVNNLRWGTHKQNMKEALRDDLIPVGRTGHRGIVYVPSRVKPYRAGIRTGIEPRRFVYCSYHATLEEAVSARQAALKLHGAPLDV